MLVDISVLDEQEILHIRYSPEEVTGEDLSEQRSMVADILSKKGLKRVLVDASALPQFPPIITIFDHNASVASQNVLRAAKFAVVCNSLGKNEQFLETTGLNRGIHIKCFTSEQDAFSWLVAG